MKHLIFTLVFTFALLLFGGTAHANDGAPPPPPTPDEQPAAPSAPAKKASRAPIAKREEEQTGLAQEESDILQKAPATFNPGDWKEIDSRTFALEIPNHGCIVAVCGSPVFVPSVKVRDGKLVSVHA
jgi:hypothetical protein